jgi:hypothetical protein
MPLVFVHGVATRQTPAYKAATAQRDDLFRRLVPRHAAQIWDPDWGSGGVTFARGGWVPEKGAAEVWAIGTPLAAGGPSAAALLAPKDLDAALDLALGALLVERAEAGQPLSDTDAAVFEATVRYLEAGGDKTAFAATATDAQFAEALSGELQPFLPALAPAAAAAEGMGFGQDVFSAIGKAVKTVTDPLRNAGSDAVLRLIRKPLSNQVALFLGDIFVYLRWRETDGAEGSYNRILKPIVADLAAANVVRTPENKLVVVAHSLGAVILYDLLTDPRALADIQTQSGKPLVVDDWATVGAQPGLFADMGLYSGQPGGDGRLPKPDCVRRWMNVYDFTDVLSFRTTPFFADTEDFEFDNVSGALEAHTAYFQRPAFYKRLRARLGA